MNDRAAVESHVCGCRCGERCEVVNQSRYFKGRNCAKDGQGHIQRVKQNAKNAKSATMILLASHKTLQEPLEDLCGASD